MTVKTAPPNLPQILEVLGNDKRTKALEPQIAQNLWLIFTRNSRGINERRFLAYTLGKQPDWFS
jgi:hypothetical protein